MLCYTARDPQLGTVSCRRISQKDCEDMTPAAEGVCPASYSGTTNCRPF